MVLHADLEAALAALRAERAFNPEDWIEKKCKMFNDYMAKSHLSGVAVNVSGGIDSAVTIGLAKRASEMAGSPIKRIVGVCLPIHSTEKIWTRGIEVCKAFGVEGITVDQTDLFDTLSKRVETELKSTAAQEKIKFAEGQLKSYMRTPVGFFVAQVLSANGNPAVVLGTGNMDEDGYLAYFCKAGDGVCDIQLVNDLHKSEVFKVGKALSVPESVLVAPPSADLWEGQTDEDELGFSYDFIELLVHYLDYDEAKQTAFRSGLSADGLKQFEEYSARAQKIHNQNKHKFIMPLNLDILEKHPKRS
jgi:NAD+ synthase (glutamine-hydrolysing)